MSDYACGHKTFENHCSGCLGRALDLLAMADGQLTTERAAHEETRKALDLTTALMKTGEARGIAKGKEELDAALKKLEESEKGRVLSAVLEENKRLRSSQSEFVRRRLEAERDAALSRLATAEAEAAKFESLSATHAMETYRERCNVAALREQLATVRREAFRSGFQTAIESIEQGVSLEELKVSGFYALAASEVTDE